MKTPYEIKKGLECCLENRTCNGCPYYVPLTGGECLINLRADSRTRILQLEHERDEARKEATARRAANAVLRDVLDTLKLERDQMKRERLGNG